LQTKIAIAQELPPNNSVLDQKQIVVTLENQTLTYFEGTRVVGEFKISSGLIKTPTPTSEFEVISKKPIVNYIGPGYNYPKTKWNLMFKESPGGNYYIHGAYWHNNFGKPMSGGCVNVSYANMEGLYDWADVGTKIIIQEKAKRHPRGTVVLSDGTVYFLGDKIRYPFPSPDVFYSWGLKFDDVLNANDLDMVMPLGPIVEFKTLAIR
jgi:hypothetical protein